MIRFNYLAAGVCAGLSLLNTATAQKKPHVILLMTDQQRADAMGCTGNETVLTPNMDKLAEDGNLFNNGYSSVPSSTPARAGLVTGMSPWAHGMLGYGQEAERYEHEMPRIMGELGYITIGIGKMHWYPQNNMRGFQTLLLDESGRVDSDNFMSDYRKWFNTQALGLDPDVTGIGWNDHGARVYQLPENLHPTFWTTKVAVETIRGYQSDKPLFMKVSYARPHSPYDPPARFMEMYDSLEVAEPLVPAIGEWEPESWRAQTDPTKNPSAAVGNFGEEYAKNSRRHYNASITFIDEQFGHIIDELKAKGIYDDALIIFVSDHGDMMGDHCLWRKTYAYEGSAAVPYIVKLPKDYQTHIKAGEEIDLPVELRDILPTMIDIAQGEQPEIMDGASLLDIYDQKDPQWREFIDLEHATCYFKENYWTSLTDGKIKYVWFMPTGEEQLFDLTKDPDELKELSKDRKYKKTLEYMRGKMVEHLEVRGEEWVKDGELQVLNRTIIYGENFPQENSAQKK
ncbi:MAG: arylsulfatase [Rikenellaceae bacterium]